MPGPPDQGQRYETLYSTQTVRDDLLLTSTIDPLFSFLLSVVGSSRIFLFELFQYFMSVTKLILCQQVTCYFHSLPKQMLMLDKIFTTESSTAFVHTRPYNQHKMKVPWRGFKVLKMNELVIQKYFFFGIILMHQSTGSILIEAG